MITKKLRIPGSPVPHDYESWEDMVADLSSLFPLTDNIVVYTQGNQTFGQDDFLNSPISPSSANWNGHYISITTDLTEITRPTKILGSIRSGSDQRDGFLDIKNLKCYGNFSAPIPYSMDSNVSFPCQYLMENCFIAARMSFADYKFECTNGFGFVKSSTMAFTTNGVGGVLNLTSTLNIDNGQIYVYDNDGSPTLIQAGISGPHTNNTAFNYAPGKSIFFNTGTWPYGIINQNPRLATQVLVAAQNEDPALIIAKSPKLTRLSAACLRNSDMMTSTPRDIINETRDLHKLSSGTVIDGAISSEGSQSKHESVATGVLVNSELQSIDGSGTVTQKVAVNILSHQILSESSGLSTKYFSAEIVSHQSLLESTVWASKGGVGELVGQVGIISGTGSLLFGEGEMVSQAPLVSGVGFIIDPFMTAQYKFNEKTGTAADDTGYAGVYDGTLTNMTGKEWYPGINGNCLAFNNLKSNVVIPGGGLNLASGINYSMTAWVKSSSANGYIVGAPYYQYLTTFMYLESGTLWLKRRNNTSIYATYPSDDRWHMVVATYNDTTYAISLYIDGALVASNATGTAQAVTGFGYMIGACTDAGSNIVGTFDGSIDDVRIYHSKELPATRVAALYQEGSTGHREVGYWKFDETSGDTAADSTENNRPISFSNKSHTWMGGRVNNGLLGAQTAPGTYAVLNAHSDFQNPHMSMAFWIRNIENYTTFIRKYIPSQDDPWKIEFTPQGTGNPRYVSWIVNETACISSTQINTANIWYHITVTYDGQYQKIYINGVLNATLANSNGIQDGSGNIHLMESYFGAQVDELHYFNYALTPDEIYTLVWNPYSLRTGSGTLIKDNNITVSSGRYHKIPAPTSAEIVNNASIIIATTGDQALVNYWKFDEASGTTAYDSSGYGKNLTLYSLSGPVPTFGPGLIGNAMTKPDYTNNGARREVAENIGTYNFTISMWIRIDGYYCPFEFNGASGSIGSFIYYPSGNFSMNIQSGGSVGFTIPGAIDASTVGLWWHIAIVRNGNNFKWYVNNLLVYEVTNAAVLTGYSSCYKRLGMRSDGYPVPGLYDETRIYKRTLTEEEIGAIAIAPNIFCKFDETSGTNVRSTTALKNGTTHGTTSWVAGKIGGALQIGSTANTDYVVFGGTIFGTKYTISVWVNVSSGYGTTRGVISTTSGVGKALMIWIQSSSSGGKVKFLTNNNGPQATLDSVSRVDNGLWHHICLVRNTDDFQMYIDNVLESSTTASGIGNPTGGGFYLGRGDSSIGGTALSGIIDQFKMYRRALSAVEIQGLYNEKLPTPATSVLTLASNIVDGTGYWNKVNNIGSGNIISQKLTSDSTGLHTGMIYGSASLITQEDLVNKALAYYNFNEGYGLVAKDSSSHGHQADLIGYQKPTWTYGPNDICALQYNGISSIVDTHLTTELAGLTGLTIAGWIYVGDSWTDPVGIFAFGNGNHYLGIVTAGGGWRWGLPTTVGGTVGATVGFAGLNAWHYVVLRFTGSVAQLIVDEIVVDSIPASGVTSYSSGASVIIGGLRSDAPETYIWPFKIGEIGIYPLSLTDEELADLRNGDKHLRLSGATQNFSIVGSGELVIQKPSLIDRAMAFYGFSEGYGSVAKDLSGNGHDVSLVNTAWASGPPGVGGSLSFDGSTSYGATDLDYELVGLSSMTISSWVYYGSTPPVAFAFSRESMIGMGMSGAWQYYYALKTTTGGTTGAAISSPVPPTNSWVHTVLRYDGNFVQFFANGVSIAKILARGVTQQTGGGAITQTFSFGCYQNSIDYVRYYFWPWNVAETAIYNFALTDAEITQLYNKDKGVTFYGTGLAPQKASSDILLEQNVIDGIGIRTIVGSGVDAGISTQSIEGVGYWNKIDNIGSGNIDLQSEIIYGIGHNSNVKGSGNLVVTNIRSWYKFDESSGVTARSSGYNTSDATIVNPAASPWVAGKIGNAVDISGTNPSGNYITIPANVEHTAGYTVAFWFKYTSGVEIFLGDYDHRFGANIDINMSSIVIAYHFTGNGPNVNIPFTLFTQAYLSGGPWHHITVTWDRSTFRAYGDGVFIDSRSVSSIWDKSSEGTRMGTYPDYYPAAYQINCKFDDLRIYTYALTGDQISDIYNLNEPNLQAVTGSGSMQHVGSEEIISQSQIIEGSGCCIVFGSGDLASQQSMVSGSGFGPGLVLGYNFNETSGSSAFDSGVAGYTGTLINSPSRVPGISKNALSLNGTTQYVNAGNLLTFEKTDKFSFSLWINYSASSGGFYCPITKVSNDSSHIGIQFGVYGGKVWLGLITQDSVSGAVVNNTSESTTVSDDKWHHVVTTYNGNTYASGIKIYVDNILQTNTVYLDNAAASPISNSSNLTIGSRNGVDAFLPGMLDEVRVYNKVLSVSEVDALYKINYGELIHQPEIISGVGAVLRLISLWRFDESSGSTAYDSGLRGHDVALTPSVFSFPRGLMGNALKFDTTYGGGEGAVGGNLSDFDRFPMSLSIWVKNVALMPSGTGFYFIYATHISIAINYAGREIWMSAGSSGWQLVGAVPMTNNWTHLVIVLNGSGQSGTSTDFYVNKGAPTTNVFSMNLPAPATEVKVFKWGFENILADDYRIYNYALSTNEIAALYDMAPWYSDANIVNQASIIEGVGNRSIVGSGDLISQSQIIDGSGTQS